MADERMVSNGMRTARTAQDVAQLEADNEYLHNENERLSRELAVITADRSRLQVENALLEGRAREATLKASRIETIVRVHSGGLVSALQEIAQERNVERAVRRQVQEDQLMEETGPAPTFLRNPANSRVMVESNQDREDRLRGAAERVAPMPPPFKRPKIDPTLAERDTRMPSGPSYGEEQSDDEDLQKLAGDMSSRQA